jgi:hypothetical protein
MLADSTSSSRRSSARPVISREEVQERKRLAKRLRRRLPEIEQATLTRLYGISAAPERSDLDYAEGLRSATSAALAHLLGGVEGEDVYSAHPPPAVLVQARVAASYRVGLDTVMHRCFAGYNLFGDFLLQELEGSKGVEPDLPRRLLRGQAVLFERMLSAVAEEYSREVANGSALREQRRTQLVEGLLGGELLDAFALGYDLEGHHLAIVAKGPRVAELLAELARRLGRRLLCVPRGQGLLWAWLGGRSPLDLDVLLSRPPIAFPPQVSLAFGEPGQGIGAWRLSHRQAAAALPVALGGYAPVVRFANVALLAGALRDDLLATFLRKVYLEPLEAERDGGEEARETLCAYLEADRNISSAAIRLGIDRHTLRSRLHSIEARLARTVSSCEGELRTALDLARLTNLAHVRG